MEFQINETERADGTPVWTIVGYSHDGANGWRLGIELPSEAAAYRVVDTINTEIEGRAQTEERPMRYALVTTRDADERERIAAYLPDNYRVIGRTPITATAQVTWLIGGSDVAGWTLDDYVIPRLASGLIFAEEIA